MVREVLTNDEGLATGVSYVSKDDMQEYQVKAKVVILAASACESATTDAEFKIDTFPNGLANSSDVVGKYLHDSTGAIWAECCPNCLAAKDIMKMVLVACTCILHGGLIIKNLIFRGISY